jgi:hypothetical protein
MDFIQLPGPAVSVLLSDSATSVDYTGTFAISLQARFLRQFALPALPALAALAGLACGTGAALAQSATCNQLNAMLQSLDSNPALRNASQTSDNLAALEANERNAEQAYLRTGCQAAQDSGQRQTPQCRGIARQILGQRAQIAQMQQNAGTGSALLQQRDQVMQQMARYRCVPLTSGASFSNTTVAPPPRGILDQLFGPPAQDGYDDGQYPPYGAGNPFGTIRTLCVRLSDGYYWPISYSTTPDYIPQDAETCAAECPNQQVELYYYDNPGQDPTQMVNAMGEPYSALPSAFAYRKQFDLKNSCRTQPVLGTVTVDASAGGMARAVVSTTDASFPLPVPDPRVAHLPPPGRSATLTAATIPLPRPRPDPTAPVAVEAPAPATPVTTRVVRVGDKLVRLVGPETPYAPQPGTQG